MDLSFLARTAPRAIAQYQLGRMQGEDERKAEERQRALDAFAQYARRRQLEQADTQMQLQDAQRQATLEQNAAIQKMLEQGRNARNDETNQRFRDIAGDNAQLRRDLQTQGEAFGGRLDSLRTALMQAQINSLNARANQQGQQHVPASAMAYIRERESGLQQIERARQAVQAHPQAFGMKNFLPGQMGRNLVNERIDPEGIAARSAVGLMGGQQLHNLGGSNLTAAERQLYEPGIPSLTNDSKTILEKLNQLEAQYRNDILNAKTQYGMDDESQAAGDVTGEMSDWLRKHRGTKKP